MSFRQTDIIFMPISIMGVGLYGFGLGGKLLILAALLFSLVGYSDRATIRPPTIRPIAIPALMIFFYMPFSIAYGYANFSSFLVDVQFYLFIVLLLLSIGRVRVDLDQDFSRFILWVRISLLIHLLGTAIYGFTGGVLFLFDYGENRRLHTVLGPATSAIYYLAILIPHLASFSRHYRVLSLDALVCLVGIILIFLTGSRTALFASLLAVSFVVIFDKRIRFATKSFLVGLLFVFFGWLFLLNLDRIFFDDTYSLETVNTSGRTRIWDTLLDQIEENPFFGFGHGSVNPVLMRHDEEDWRTGEDQSHNDYLRIIFNTGLFGLLMFGIIVIGILKALPRSIVDKYGTFSDLDKTLLLYTFVFLVMMITDNVFIYHFFIYPYLVVAAIGWKVNHSLRQY